MSLLVAIRPLLLIDRSPTRKRRPASSTAERMHAFFIFWKLGKLVANVIGGHEGRRFCISLEAEKPYRWSLLPGRCF